MKRKKQKETRRGHKEGGVSKVLQGGRFLPTREVQNSQRNKASLSSKLEKAEEEERRKRGEEREERQGCVCR